MPPNSTTPTKRRIFPHSPWRPGKARTGKIAHLPEKLRDAVNHMLLDGFTYHSIIAKLGPEGEHLNGCVSGCRGASLLPFRSAVNGLRLPDIKLTGGCWEIV